MVRATKSLLEKLFTTHSGALQSFFRQRVRGAAETQDLAQEVYLRLLRISETEVIRNPEAYLFTVASNLLKEHVVLEKRRGWSVEPNDVADELLDEKPTFDDLADGQLRARRLSEVLAQLGPKCRLAVLLKYRDGLSYEEIGAQLDISANMVKKYLVTALAHCRKRMARWR